MILKEFAIIPVIFLLPAAGAVILGLGGRKLGEKTTAWLANLAVFGSFAASVYAYLFLLCEPNYTAYYWNLYTFLSTGFIKVEASFLFDRLSAQMALVVTGVSSFIHLYSVGYMKGDSSFTRYYSHLNMFVFFMLVLVLGKNLVMLFIGWEGVGLCSYLLIGFWFDDMKKAVAGKKAFIVNRIGDFGFIIAIFLLLMYNKGTVDVLALRQWITSAEGLPVNEATLTVITMLLFVGAIGKSAQIPLYVWLPDAMAGPTPVSALIHAATMVTAGVFMLSRLAFLFVSAPITMAVVATVGGTTAVLAATIGLAQTDIKKVLAYSTISQLGYMFLAAGSGAFAAAQFHLTTHAFFKACLFLGAGSVIHALSGEQNIFKMGGLLKKMPVTAITFLISTLAISGIPPLSGFFSKDEILSRVFLAQTEFPILYRLLWILGLVGAFLTAVYMLRLYWLTFHTETRMDRGKWEHAHESPLSMTVPLMVLAGCAVAGGALGIPGEYNLFERWLVPVVGSYSFELDHVSPVAHLALGAVSVIVALAGLLGAWLIYRKGIEPVAKKVAEHAGVLYKLVAGKYFVDELYDLLIVRPFVVFASICYRIVDVIFIDILGVNLPAYLVKAVGVIPRLYHNGSLQRYLAAFAIGLAFLLIFV